MQAVENPWLGHYLIRPQARARLICFHHAGGGASSFRLWPSLFPDSLEICPVQLPGRENRIRQPLYSDARLLAAELAAALQPVFSKPFAFFGHSLGAIVAFELTRHLIQTGSIVPKRLFLSSRWAPHTGSGRRRIHGLPGPEFHAALRAYNGIPEAVLAEPDLMELLEPILRADLEMNECYHAAMPQPIPVPITVYGGREDASARPEDLEAWRSWTTGAFSLHLLPGDHFYLKTCPELLAESIQGQLETSA